MDGDAVLVNRDALAGYVRRVASLHDDRDELNGDIREVYKEAKDAGIDTTILREIVREHRTDAEARNSRYALLDGYRHEFGSLIKIEGDAEFQRLPSDQQDLLLHLVAAHHGAAAARRNEFRAGHNAQTFRNRSCVPAAGRAAGGRRR